MWTPIGFIVLLAAAASAEYGFKTGTEYKYEVTTKTFTSLQQVSQQYSGVLTRAQLTVTPKTEDEVVAFFTKTETAKVHATLPQGPEYRIPQEVVQFTPLALSKEPFVIRFKDGVVSELVVSKDLPVWEVNIIRSVVSQFQINTQGKRLLNTKLNTVPVEDENTATYKVMEDTVEGECETSYDVTPLPKYLLQNTPNLAPTYHLGDKEELIEVMKTKNFSHCEQRPAYHFGFTGLTNWNPATNKMGNFLSRSSVSRIVLSGTLKSYTIHSSVTTNKVVVSPELYNNQKGEVVSRVNVTLVSVQAGTPTVPETQNPQVLKKLVYDFNGPFTTDAQVREKWDQRQEQSLFPEQMRNSRGLEEKILVLNNEGWYQTKPKMTQAPDTPFLPYYVGYLGHSIQHSKEVNVNQVVRKMTEQIGQQVTEQSQLAQENTLDRYSILVNIIRTMNAKQLEQSVQELYTPEKEGTQGTQRNTWMVFRDALSQAGTGPALTTIVSLITSQKVKREEAAELVTVLPETVRYPTTEYMNTFFELVKNPEVLSQHRLNSTVVHAFTKLVRFAFVDQKTVHNRYPVHSFGYLTRLDDTVVTDVYVPYFAQQLENAVKLGDSHKIQVYITALGNIAHPKVLKVFEPYLEGKQPVTDYQRTLIVVSLGKLAQVHPNLARSVLYKIYANTGEVYQVRVAAVYNLMRTNPPVSMLQRMAQFTHEDPSYQVRSAVKSAIESAALLTTKDNFELRQNAQSAVNMLIPHVYGIQYSRLNLTDYLLKGLHLGHTRIFKYIGSEDSVLPKTFLYKVLGNINGYKTTLLKASGMVSSVQAVYDFLQDIYTFGQDETPIEGTDNEFTVEKIFKSLNLEHTMKQQVEGNLAFKLGSFHRFFTFDNHTFEALPNVLNKYVQMLTQGKVFNYQKLFSCFEVVLAVPTATGLPFVYTLTTPLYLGIKGKVQVNVPEISSTQNKFLFPKTGTVTTNVEVTFSTNKQGQISFVTPYDHQRYVSGYRKQVHVNLPLKGNFNFDFVKRHYQLEIKPVETKRGDYKLLHYSTLPYTAVQDVVDFKPITECANVKLVVPTPLKHFTQQFGNNYFGATFQLAAKTSKRNVDFKKIVYDFFKRHDHVSPFVYPVIESSIDNTHVDFYYDGKKSTAESVEFSATYRTVTLKDVKHETDYAKVFVPTPDTQTRVKTFYEEVGAGIKVPTVYVADLSLKVKEQGKSTPVEFVATVGCARSPIDPQTKVLAYLYRTKENKKYEVCWDQVYKKPYVSTVDYEKAINTDAHLDTTAHLKFGEKCESGSKVTFTGTLKRSQERREYVQTLPQTLKCKSDMQQGVKYTPNCKNATYEAGLLDKYSFNVQYDNVPEYYKNLTYHFYSMIRHVGYSYVTEKLSFGQTAQDHKLELDVNYKPDLQTFDLYVTAPYGVAQFRDVYVPHYLKNLAATHSVYTLCKRYGWLKYNQQYKSYCTIDKTQIKTFDNQTYTATLGNVWHVMTVTVPKTTSENQLKTTNKEFSVLVREGADHTKEVKLTFGYSKGPVVTFTPSQGKPHGTMTVNGQPLHFDEKGYYDYRNQLDTVIFKAYVLPTNEIKFESPVYKFDLVYDQTRVQLTLRQRYRNRVGGLCGVYTGEEYNYVTPQGYILQAPEEFAATWALTNEGHVGELKKKAHEHSVYKKLVHYTTILGKDNVRNLDTYDSSEEDSGEQETHGKCTTKRIMVIERNGKHCFSVNPQIACKSGCQVEKTKPMTADFICVNKTQTSSHWAQMVGRGAQPNFKNKGNAQKMQFEGPEVCSNV